jgi:hypothetical protein
MRGSSWMLSTAIEVQTSSVASAGYGSLRVPFSEHLSFWRSLTVLLADLAHRTTGRLVPDV